MTNPIPWFEDSRKPSFNFLSSDMQALQSKLKGETLDKFNYNLGSHVGILSASGTQKLSGNLANSYDSEKYEAGKTYIYEVNVYKKADNSFVGYFTLLVRFNTAS